MLTKYILGALALLFLLLAVLRATGAGAAGQRRTWLLIAVIFGIVSAYLFYQQGI